VTSRSELDKQYPNLVGFWPYLDIIRRESPRGRVLVSTGFLEQQLRDVLAALMRETPQVTELLDGANAPLGTFSSRISACFALGLIKEHEHHDLTLIRRIRNDFAHDIHTTFETPSVVDRCKLLRMKAHDYVHAEMGEVTVPSAGQFETAAVSLIMNLTNRPHYVRERRATTFDWPY
jgi:mannitol operon repressor